MIGSTNIGNKQNFIKRFKFLKQEGMTTDLDVHAVLEACEKMSKTKTGAILVFERSNSLDFVSTSGDKMNAEINQPILGSIFYKNSPLHDGAAIIRGNRIIATRVILPLSQERNIPLRFGLRHRAAIGITEKTDALALVLSEETGSISYIKNGEFVLYKDMKDLEELLNKDLQ
jgi:DNA integrity scanning protein DisA with diadenylate cyclase activity